MSDNVDESINQLARVLQPKRDLILQARVKANKFAHDELQAKNSIVELSTRLAELEAGGKKKEKDLKKLQATFEKVKQDASTNEKGRADAELDLVMKETNSQEEFYSALLQLESLALYRLDTVKDLMRRLAFAEQTALTRLGLKFQIIINDCSNIDTIRDLVLLSQDAEKLALEKRAEAIRHAQEAQTTATEITPIPTAAEEDVPVAEKIVATPRKRWM